MKRFYKSAGVRPEGDGYAIVLDGKAVKTPAKTALAVKSKPLAEAIAAEWNAQGEDVKPAALQLTRLAGTATDLVRPKRDQVVAEIAKYAGTDLVCYRAADPPELVTRQTETWQPLLEWAGERYAPLGTTNSVVPVTQTPEALDAYRQAIAVYDDMILTALYIATSALGSLVLALALVEGRIDPEEAFVAAQLDESFQIEQWGEDAEATSRRAALKEDILLAARFAGLHRAA